jgi:hypothetical protein
MDHFSELLTSNFKSRWNIATLAMILRCSGSLTQVDPALHAVSVRLRADGDDTPCIGVPMLA